MKYKPILVASTGRAGSTLLMKILASHPEISVRSLFPYETRASQYYYICDREGINPTEFAPVTWNNFEYRPFQANDKQSTLWSQKQKSLEQQPEANLSEAYYSFVSGIENKAQVKYFAEKLVGLSLVKPMINWFTASKIIFLKRDPRDTFFSIKSFNKKRGYLSFGEQQGESALLANIIGFYKHSQKIKQSLDRDKDLDLEYEQLITKKMATISQLFQALNLDYSDRQVLSTIENAFAESPETLKHKTSSDLHHSMSRWKREADKRILEIFASFEKDFEQIGYCNQIR